MALTSKTKLSQFVYFSLVLREREETNTKYSAPSLVLVTPKPGPYSSIQPHSSPAPACFKQAKPRNIYETKGVGKWTCFLFLSFRLKLQKRLGASGRQQYILCTTKYTSQRAVHSGKAVEQWLVDKTSTEHRRRLLPFLLGLRCL